MKRVLVTGGVGFIGSHLVEALLGRGDRVVVLDNLDDFLYSSELKRENLGLLEGREGFEFIEGDIRSLEDLDRAFSGGVDVVVHLAARAGVRPSLEAAAEYASINVEGTIRVMDKCREYGVGRLVFASSSSVYGSCRHLPFREDMAMDWFPASPYASSKLAGELFCHNYHRLYGLNIFCLRFFTVYGPRQRPDMAIGKFTRLLFEGSPIPLYGDGGTLRDYTFISDIVDGVVRSVDRVEGFEVLNLGRGEPVYLRDLVEVLGRVSGREVELERLPMQRGDVVATHADITKARRVLGYEPRVGLEEGIRRYIDWFLGRDCGRC